MSRYQLAPTVVLVDDDPGERAELAEVIASHPDLALVGVGTCEAQGAELCAHHRPDVVVVDLAAPEGDVLAVDAIRSVSPGTAIVDYTPLPRHRAHRSMPDGAAAVERVEGDATELADTLVRVGVRTTASNRAR